MQATETDIKNFKISDEDVNFRPSPNFKHMKKYFRDKFDEENSGSSNTTDSQSPTPSIKDIDKDGCPSCLESDQHPPLPPNPPPPDSPIVIKKEKEEQEEYSSNLELHDTETLSEGNLPQYNSEPSVSEVSSGESGETMCRNFIRGTCERGAACIFAHKLILSQLKYVYRFCINFQNRSGCTRPQCKFVHATVFEQEHFYKTGYLPPHTMAHLKQENSHPPPKEEVPAEVPSVFINQPPPQIQLAAMETKPLENSSKVVTLDPRVIKEVLRAAVETKLPLKREWSEIDDVVSSPRDITLSSPSAKKCKNCDFNEFRLQYIKRKCDSIKRSSEDITQKISLLNRKSTRLCTILVSVLTQKSNSGSSLLNSIGDKDSILVSQLSHLIGTNNRFSLLNEDSGKSNLLNNSIVAKLILSMCDKK